MRNSESGFTLIELIVVLSLIAIAAGLAFSEMKGAAPRARLVSDSDAIRQYFASARARAISTKKPGKLCLYVSDAPTNEFPGKRGRALWLEWDDMDATNAPTSPASGTVCTNEPAFASAAGVPAAKASAAGTACCRPGSGLPSCTDGKWCVVEDFDLGSGAHAADRVNLWQFKSFDGATVYTQQKLEITFAKDGTVMQANSDYPQGRIQLATPDLCAVDAPGNSNVCPAFANVFNVVYTVGGAARIQEGG